MKIDESDLIYLEQSQRGFHPKDTAMIATAEVNLELIRLARLGLEFQALKDQENGKANLMAVIELGRWAKTFAIYALNHGAIAERNCYEYKDHWRTQCEQALDQLPDALPKEGE